MDWYKAKTIMIVFLIAVNVGLGIYIVIDNINDKKIKNSVADEVVELLEKNNIELERKLLLSNTDSQNIKKITAQNIISDYFYFSKNIIGENVKSFKDNVYENNIGKVTFNGDNFRGESFDGYFLSEISTSKKNVKENAKKYLKSIGVDVNDVTSKLEEKDGRFFVRFQREVENKKIFKMNITVEMTPKGIVSVSGNWYNLKIENETDELKNIMGVMVEYMNTQGKKDKKIVVKNIDLGYGIISGKVFNENVEFVPVWEITDDSGNTRYINALM